MLLKIPDQKQIPATIHSIPKLQPIYSEIAWRTSITIKRMAGLKIHLRLFFQYRKQITPTTDLHIGIMVPIKSFKK